jgi:NADPH:quinone reductase-like Zn-dependent oxidoreductase
MQAAGVTQLGGPVMLLELPGPGRPGPGEVLLDVRASGAGNWDEFVRTGGWDTGTRPPMALGVEAAGWVAAVGDGVDGIAPGDAVTTHSLPLRGQGSWAEQHLAAAEHVAPVPPGVSWDAAAALPVPALTADQALAGLDIQPGQAVLVHGAGGVTGGLLVQLAAHLGGRVIATAGPGSAPRVRAQGAATVLDYHDPDWPGQVRSLTGGGADAAVNAAPSGANAAMQAVRDGGRLATITGEAPGAGRGVAVTSIVVVPDGPRLRMLTGLLGQGAISISVGGWYPLEQAGGALAQARQGAHGAALVIRPAAQDGAGPGAGPLAVPGESGLR